MMKALAKAGDGTNVIGESMKTFSMSEGKNKKGDVTVSQADMPAALAALKAQVEAAKVEIESLAPLPPRHFPFVRLTA